MTLRQLPLPFRAPASFAEADFVPGGANQEALVWLSRWPDWPSRRLALWGPTGSGKSHLAAIWRARTRAGLTTGRALAGAAPADALAEPPHALVIEDADAAPQGRALLHLLNAMAEAGGSVLITCREPPARWATKLPDLASRLAATASVAISPPDEALVEAVLAKALADRQLALRPELVSWLALRLPRDFATLHLLVAELDSASLAEARRVTRAAAAAALARALSATGHAAPAEEEAPAGGDDNSMPGEGGHSPGRGFLG